VALFLSWACTSFTFLFSLDCMVHHFPKFPSCSLLSTYVLSKNTNYWHSYFLFLLLRILCLLRGKKITQYYSFIIINLKGKYFTGWKSHWFFQQFYLLFIAVILLNIHSHFSSLLHDFATFIEIWRNQMKSLSTFLLPNLLVCKYLHQFSSPSELLEDALMD
jgi:hypothetical protein